jgi:AraC-like DNA-binding protein
MLLDRLMKDLHVSVGPFAMCEIASGSRLLIGELGWVTIHFVLAGSGWINIGRTPGPEISKYTLALVKQKHVLEGSRGDETSVEESREHSEGSLGIIEALMRQCLVLLLRRLKDTDDSRLTFLDGLQDARMSAVITEILDRPADPHTVQSMASTAMMSRSAFSDRFKECFNDTPMAFVRHVRLRQSAEMLRTTRKSVGSIATETGFSSRSHFSQAFSAEYDIAPGEFRKRIRQESMAPPSVDLSA